MLNLLLHSLLFVTFAIADPNEELARDLGGIRKFMQGGNNGTIGELHPNKTTIGLADLDHMEKSLDGLEPKMKRKRQADDDFGLLDDDVEDISDTLQPLQLSDIQRTSTRKPAQQSPDNSVNYEVKTSMSNVEVPIKGGSPAFSIHADKVYILYPSLFQDPNIFGRFSIPQNINLDPQPERTETKSTEKNDPPRMMPHENLHDDPDQPKKVSRRQAPNPPPQPSEKQSANSPSQHSEKQAAYPPSQTGEKTAARQAPNKKNVETHLTGTIVVLNQDVNEINKKDSY